MLTLLTATGGRPEAWALCERYMMRQTYAGPVRWLIVDDGPEPQPITFERAGWTLEVIRPRVLWQPGQNTQARNLLAGLAHCAPDVRLVIIEDDDAYAADWLDTVAHALERAELVGETQARYYNVATRQARQLRNTGHASLCATAMRGRAIEAFRDACRRRPKFIDLELWQRHRGTGYLFEGHRVVGLKGLPGRAGIGMGHRPAAGWTGDADGSILSQWIGDAAGWYR